MNRNRTQDAFETVELTVKDGPDVVITGRLIASIDSRDHVPENSRNSGRWTELKVYECPSGDWVAVEIAASDRKNETTYTKYRLIADVRGSEPADRPTTAGRTRAVMEAFGWGWLAKKMAAEAGWDVREKFE